MSLGSIWTSTRLGGCERDLHPAEAKRKFNKLFNGVYGLPEARRNVSKTWLRRLAARRRSCERKSVRLFWMV